MQICLKRLHSGFVNVSDSFLTAHEDDLIDDYNESLAIYEMPPGYTVKTDEDDFQHIFDPQGNYCEVINMYGKPRLFRHVRPATTWVKTVPLEFVRNVPS